MRFHVLGVPHTRTTPEYTSCAFTQKVYKFCKMMGQRGHTLFHYGVEGSDAPYAENITVVSNETYDKVYGSTPKQGPYHFDHNDACYQEFFKNAIIEVGKHKQPNDFILPFWGVGVRDVCDAHKDIITVEPGIGYPTAFARFRIYESYAWLHAQLGTTVNPDWYYQVIPNYFDLDDFDYNPSLESRLKDPYFLYLGRVTACKGINVAMQVCEKLGVKLIMSGPLFCDYKDYKWKYPIEYVGPSDVEKRKELMKNAVASFMPTVYSEPFGGVQVENFLSGTPVISTDWGAFPEVNIHGVTGYRCKTFDDFLNAALNCLEGKIKPEDCRRQGEKYSLENIAPMYEKYFGDVLNIYTGNGWYELSPETERRLSERDNW